MAKKKNNKNRSGQNNKTKKISNYNRKTKVVSEVSSVTHQQQFDFGGELDSIENLDVSFVEEKERKNVRKKLVLDEKKDNSSEKKGNFTTILLIVILILLGLLICFFVVYFNGKNNKNIVEKIVEKTIVDDNYLFLGDSITDYYDLDKFYEGLPVVNSGISGNRTTDILNDMKNRVYKYNPSKIFLLIGTNDFLDDVSDDEIADNIGKIIKLIKENRPYAEIYLESIYPVNKNDDEKISLSMVSVRDNEHIKSVNDKLKELCKEEKITYIDLYSKLADDDGNLKLEYTIEGLHLSEDGYKVVTDAIFKYIKNN